MREVTDNIDLFIKLYNLKLKVIETGAPTLNESDHRKLRQFFQEHTPDIFTLEKKEEVTDFHKCLPVSHPDFKKNFTSLGFYEEKNKTSWWDSKDFTEFLWHYAIMQKGVDEFLETGTYSKYLLGQLSGIGNIRNRVYIAVDMDRQPCRTEVIDSQKYRIVEGTSPSSGFPVRGCLDGFGTIRPARATTCGTF